MIRWIPCRLRCVLVVIFYKGKKVGECKRTLENSRVARLDGQTGNVGNDFGTSLEDDEQDANGARDALHDEVVI